MKAEPRKVNKACADRDESIPSWWFWWPDIPMNHHRHVVRLVPKARRGS